MAAVDDDFCDLSIEWICEANMSNDAFLEEGKRSDTCTTSLLAQILHYAMHA
jgi:hypothetical protein